MPDTASITLVKRFTYRGNNEEWGNTYHFTGTTPADSAAWLALGVALFTNEKECYTADNKLVKIYGYAPGNEHSVFQKDYVSEGLTLLPGILSADGTVQKMAGDQAAWIRALIGTNSRGRKVYIRKYFHGGTLNPANPDQLSTGAYQSALSFHMTKLLDGSLPGGFKWSGPQGQTATNPVKSTFVTTRTLKRRGKRP